MALTLSIKTNQRRHWFPAVADQSTLTLKFELRIRRPWRKHGAYPVLPFSRLFQSFSSLSSYRRIPIWLRSFLVSPALFLPNTTPGADFRLFCCFAFGSGDLWFRIWMRLVSIFEGMWRSTQSMAGICSTTSLNRRGIRLKIRWFCGSMAALDAPVSTDSFTNTVGLFFFGFCPLTNWHLC